MIIPQFLFSGYLIYFSFQTNINITEQKIFQDLHFMIKYSFVYVSTFMRTPLWDSGLLEHYFLLLEVLVPSAAGSYQTMFCLLECLDFVHAYSLRMPFSCLFRLFNTLSTFKRYQLCLEVAPDSLPSLSEWVVPRHFSHCTDHTLVFSVSAA